MTAVLLVFVAVFCFGFLLWGQSGGLVTGMQQRITVAEATIQVALEAKGFTVEHMVCAWPKDTAAGPGAALALNRSEGKLAHVGIQGERCSWIMLHPSELLSITLMENNAAVGTVNRAAQLGGAAVGGLLAGETGALVGGLTTGQVTTQRLDRIGLLIVAQLHDGAPLTIDFCFWDRASTNGWANLDEAGQRQMMGTARRWLAFLDEFARGARHG